MVVSEGAGPMVARKCGRPGLRVVWAMWSIQCKRVILWTAVGVGGTLRVVVSEYRPGLPTVPWTVAKTTANRNHNPKLAIAYAVAVRSTQPLSFSVFTLLYAWSRRTIDWNVELSSSVVAELLTFFCLSVCVCLCFRMYRLQHWCCSLPLIADCLVAAPAYILHDVLSADWPSPRSIACVRSLFSAEPFAP